MIVLILILIIKNMLREVKVMVWFSITKPNVFFVCVEICVIVKCQYVSSKISKPLHAVVFGGCKGDWTRCVNNRKV